MASFIIDGKVLEISERYHIKDGKIYEVTESYLLSKPFIIKTWENLTAYIFLEDGAGLILEDGAILKLEDL